MIAALAPELSRRIEMLNTEPVTDAIPSDIEGVDTTGHDSQTRWAFWTFVVYLAGALPFLLWMGSYRWFFGDEWSFLADRSVTFDGLFRPHNQQHWVTIPVLAYRGLYSLVGLHAYWPYQLPVILLHLTTAALLRVIMRRAGVGPWLATVAAGVFVLLGSAEDNILWAFQITFVGALVFGLTQIILADHDGPINRRDWIGLGAGLLALMMSGQAPPLIVGAGLVCLLRRRWTAALLHTVPLGIIYLAWVRLEHVSTVYHLEGHPFTLSAYLQWMKEAAIGLFVGLGHFAPVGILLAMLLVGGTLLAWRSEGTAAFVGRAAVPISLMAVCALAMTTAAPSRFFLGAEAARAGRYIGVMAALTLPLLAVAADAITRRWSRLLPAVCLVLLLPVPVNAVQFGDDQLTTPQYYRSLRAFTAALPDQPLAAQVPPWVQPNSSILGQPDMTVGWLLQAQRDGALPPPQPLDPFQRLMLPLQLGVADTGLEPSEGLSCVTYDEPIALDPQVGDRLWFPSGSRIAERSGDTASSPARPYDDSVVEITLPDLHLLALPVPGENSIELCR